MRFCHRADLTDFIRLYRRTVTQREKNVAPGQEAKSPVLQFIQKLT